MALAGGGAVKSLRGSGPYCTPASPLRFRSIEIFRSCYGSPFETMARGRPKKPTALAIIQGNPGKRKLNDAEPAPPGVDRLPPPPSHLSQIAMDKWDDMGPVLLGMGCLTRSDLDVFETYCTVYGMLHEMDAASRVDWQSADDPADALKGVIAAQRRAEPLRNQFIRIACELGMTPAARTKIRVDKPERDGLEALVS